MFSVLVKWMCAGVWLVLSRCGLIVLCVISIWFISGGQFRLAELFGGSNGWVPFRGFLLSSVFTKVMNFFSCVE